MTYEQHKAYEDFLRNQLAALKNQMALLESQTTLSNTIVRLLKDEYYQKNPKEKMHVVK